QAKGPPHYLCRPIDDSKVSGITQGACPTSLRGVEDVSGLVVHRYLGAGVGWVTAFLGSRASLRVSALDVTHARERAGPFVRRGLEQQPGNSARSGRIGALLNLPGHLAPVRGFPGRTFIVLANLR